MSSANGIESPLLDIPQAQAYLHVSRSSVFRLLGEGQLVGVKVRRRRLVLRSSVDALVAKGAPLPQ